MNIRLADNAAIAAPDESTAAAAHATYEEVRAACAAAGVVARSAPLVLAVGPGQPPLFGAAKATFERLATWHIQATEDGGRKPKLELPPDAPVEVLELMSAAFAAAFPPTAPELALPAEWAALASWGVVVPTDATIDAAADAVIDFGLAKEDISFGQRLLLAPLMPIVRSKARGALREAVLRQMVAAVVANTCAERPVPRATVDACLGQLGIGGRVGSRDPAVEAEGNDG